MEVEIFNGKKRPVYWYSQPGTPLPTPAGFMDDTDIIPGRPEFHLLSVPHAVASVDRQGITIHINPDISAGFRDDFVRRRIKSHEFVGAKIGW